MLLHHKLRKREKKYVSYAIVVRLFFAEVIVHTKIKDLMLILKCILVGEKRGAIRDGSKEIKR